MDNNNEEMRKMLKEMSDYPHDVFDYGCTSFGESAAWALKTIDAQQAEIERLQPKKGKWIEIESQTGVGAFGFNEVTVNAFRCSECRKKIDVSDGNFKYCPYCGAIMKDGDGDG